MRLSEDEVMEAAAKLLDEGGELSIRAVAQRLGVARGTVYRHFRDADALVRALVAAGRIAAEPPDPRERALDAVAALLRRRSLAGLSVEEVAAEAGLGVATIYRRFGDRRGLLLAFAAERSPRRLAALPKDLDGERALRLLVREAMAFAREYPGLFALSDAPDPESVALFAEIRQGSTSSRALIARAVERLLPDADPRAAQALLGMVASVGLSGGGEVDADARFVVDLFLRGMGRSSQPEPRE